MPNPIRSSPRATILTGLLAVVVLLRLTGCADPSAPTGRGEPGGQGELDRSGTVAPLTTASPGSVVLVGAADIAHCGSNQGDEKTAALINGVLASDPGATVFAAGDVIYENGTTAEFANCYAPSWGAFKASTRPAIGNHEYNVSSTPYFDYFGEVAAGPRDKGYYSYDIGQWHIVVLNSNHKFVPTAVGSAQDTWLKADLAATSKPCVLAYWHHPRFVSAASGTPPAPYVRVKPFWDALYAAKADVVLVGHQHFYERFAPQTPAGALDTENGIRQFVVGMGGKSTGPQPTGIAPNSEVRHGGNKEFGILKLTLAEADYTWEYIPVAGKTFTDAGSGTCHPKPGGGGGAGTIAINGGSNQSAVVGTAVSTPPSVRVTDAGGTPVEDVAVTFAVTAGGGSVTGAAQTTGAGGIATVGSWSLGTTAGSNRLTATSAGFTGSPVTFSATGTPGPADAAASTATVPNGTVGSPTTLTVQAKDQFGNNLTTGGGTVVVAVTGANSATPDVTDNGGGTYSAAYTPATAGSDQVAITLGGTAIGGSPYPSTVTAAGATMSIAVEAGDNQTATAGTTLPIRAAVKVTDANGNPVAGLSITWAVSSGGGTATGVRGTTTLGGIARVGTWTLGPIPGPNTLTATAAGTGIANNPLTFTATGN